MKWKFEDEDTEFIFICLISSVASVLVGTILGTLAAYIKLFN